MNNVFEQHIKNLQEHTWELCYDRESNTATFINEKGETMDFETFSWCLGALKNTLHDMEEKKYGIQIKTPLDEFTKKRLGIRDYKLITDEERGGIRSIFEVYSDENEIFTLNRFDVYNNRKLYENGFLAYLNRFEAECVLESLESFVKRFKGK